MEQNDRFQDRSLDGLPPDVKKMTLELRGLRQLQKEMSSFPSGKLKESLAVELGLLLDKCVTSAQACSSLTSEIQLLKRENGSLRAELTRCQQDLAASNREQVKSTFAETPSSRYGCWIILALVLIVVIVLWHQISIRREATIPEEKVEPSLKH